MNLKLIKDHTSLVTQRLVKQTPFIFISSISGLVVGLMSLSKLILINLEKYLLKRKYRNQKLEHIKKIADQALHYITNLPKESNNSQYSESESDRKRSQTANKQFYDSPVEENEANSINSPDFLFRRDMFCAYKFNA